MEALWRNQEGNWLGAGACSSLWGIWISQGRIFHNYINFTRCYSSSWGNVVVCLCCRCWWGVGGGYCDVRVLLQLWSLLPEPGGQEPCLLGPVWWLVVSYAVLQIHHLLGRSMVSRERASHTPVWVLSALPLRHTSRCCFSATSSNPILFVRIRQSGNMLLHIICSFLQ